MNTALSIYRPHGPSRHRPAGRGALRRFAAGLGSLLALAAAPMLAQIPAEYRAAAGNSAATPAPQVLFVGLLNGTGQISAITQASAPSAEFDFSLGRSFETFYQLFTRPTLPAFAGSTLELQLELGGRPRAYVESWSADGRTITLASSLTNLERTFTGATPQATANQYAAYYDSAQFLTDFAAVEVKVAGIAAAVSGAAQVTDGAPQAATANMALNAFQTFGFEPLGEAAANDPQTNGNATDADATKSSNGRPALGFSIFAENSRFEVDLPFGGSVKGTASRLSAPLRKDLTSKISLRAGASLDYTTIEDVKVVSPGLSVGLPVRLSAMSREKRWTWQLTPNAGLVASFVKDSANGGDTSRTVAWNYGFTNMAEYRVNDAWIVSVGNQITGHRSISVDSQPFAIGSQDIDQFILKNGVRARWKVARRWQIESTLVDTRFLRTALIKNFQSYGIGAAFLVTQRFYVGLHGKVEYGPGYFGWNGGLSSAWSF